MNAILTTTMALGVVFTLGAIQPANASIPNNAGGYDQGNIVLAHGHGGGGHGMGGGHHGGWGGRHGGWGGHRGYGYGGYGFGGGIFLDQPVVVDPGYNYDYYDLY
ncbi:MAG TPA: hypothetical protein VMW10_10295 [Alphaproteobacteria bacterium]|nr:hypothetical protein [Alphaproteobacteria bacterium]